MNGQSYVTSLDPNWRPIHMPFVGAPSHCNLIPHDSPYQISTRAFSFYGSYSGDDALFRISFSALILCPCPLALVRDCFFSVV